MTATHRGVLIHVVENILQAALDDPCISVPLKVGKNRLPQNSKKTLKGISTL